MNACTNSYKRCTVVYRKEYRSGGKNRKPRPKMVKHYVWITWHLPGKKSEWKREKALNTLANISQEIME